MASDTIAQVLKFAPNVRCFAIASDDLAKRNSERATRHLPRSNRKQAARNAYNKWKRSVEFIIDDAKAAGYDDPLIIERLKSLPLEAVNLTFDADSADSMIDRVSDEIRQRPAIGIGIWEQFVSEELVFIWLWNDH